MPFGRYAKARHRSADSCPNAVALSRKSCFKEADRCVGLFPVPPETCGANSPIFDDSHSQDFELPPRASRATGSLDSPIPWPVCQNLQIRSMCILLEEYQEIIDLSGSSISIRCNRLKFAGVHFFSRGRIAQGIKMTMKNIEVESCLENCLYTPLYDRLWSTLDKEDRTGAASMTKRTHHFSVSRKFQQCYLQNPDST